MMDVSPFRRLANSIAKIQLSPDLRMYAFIDTPGPVARKATIETTRAHNDTTGLAYGNTDDANPEARFIVTADHEGVS
ncbi:hypothetical protein [Amycolatopsis sp. NPDC051371]|uniref:hypothetical protein n=1 Tax=Amycolatopsis sp. NPDC051371 TaxID=3155800 RepID=UPI003417FA21